RERTLRITHEARAEALASDDTHLAATVQARLAQDRLQLCRSVPHLPLWTQFLEEPDPETELRDITPASVLVPEQDGRRPVAGKYQDALLEAGIDPGEVVQVSGPLTIP